MAGYDNTQSCCASETVPSDGIDPILKTPVATSLPLYIYVFTLIKPCIEVYYCPMVQVSFR